MNQMDNFKLKNQGYFFFIHSFVPHQPYVFNTDRSIKKGLDIMTHKEKDWLNGYHAEVFEEIGPHVAGEVLEWLEKAVKYI